MSQPRGFQAPGTGRETADKLKNRFQWLQSFSDYELSQISYCTEEDSMRSGEQYFDLSHPEQGVIRGSDGQGIPEGSCYVVQSDVPRHLWDKLVSPFMQAQ